MPHKTALLHIDMQYIHVHPDYSVSGRGQPAAARDYVRERLHRTVLPAIGELLAAWRAAGGLVVHIAFNHTAPDGSDLDPEIYARFHEETEDVGQWAIRTAADPLSAVLVAVAPLPGEIVLSKTTYSAFRSTNLGFVLTNHGIDSVLCLGGLTGCCVRHTAADAKQKGYRVFTCPEADIDRTQEAHERALAAVDYDGLLTLAEAKALPVR